MTDPKPKHSPALREPKPKKKLGLSVPPPLRMPHEELVIAPPPRPDTLPSQTSQTNQSTPAEQFHTLPSQTRHTAPLPARTSQTTQSRQASQTTQTRLGRVRLGQADVAGSAAMPIAPIRDYSKVANSITREAIPAGLFKGKSKQLYDYLYSATRGAIVPSRSVRLSRGKLMSGAGIGSRVTFDSNIQRLCQAGLVRVRSIAGEHEGNEYTVYLPEEIVEVLLTTPSQTSQTGMTGPAHKLDTLVSLETTPTSPSISIDESITSDTPKTFFKTSGPDDDDGAISAAFAAPILAAASQLVGAALTSSDVELDRWRDLARVLTDELQFAARRAGPVSSAPAFFAGHLRRRLSRSSPRQLPDSSGSNAGASEGEPMSDFAVERWAPDDGLLARFIEAVRGRIPEEAFTTWFQPTRALGVSDGRLYIQVPNGVFEQSIKFNYAELLDEVRIELGLDGCEVRFVY